MSGFELNVDAALAALRSMLGETTDQGKRHKSLVPAFSPAAAGRDFGAQGAAVAAMFADLHRGVDKRIGALETTTDAAARQVGIYIETDSGFAATLGATGGEGK